MPASLRLTPNERLARKSDADRPREHRRKPSLLNATFAGASLKALSALTGEKIATDVAAVAEEGRNDAVDDDDGSRRGDGVDDEDGDDGRASDDLQESPTNPATFRLPTHLWHSKRFIMETNLISSVPKTVTDAGADLSSAAALSAAPVHVLLPQARRDAAPSAALDWARESCVSHDASYNIAIRLTGAESALKAALESVLDPVLFQAGADNAATDDHVSDAGAIPQASAAVQSLHADTKPLSKAQKARIRRLKAKHKWQDETRATSDLGANARSSAAVPVARGSSANGIFDEDHLFGDRAALDVIIYEPGQYPSGAIAPATIWWLPAISAAAHSSDRSVLVFVHIAAVGAVFEAVQRGIASSSAALAVSISTVGTSAANDVHSSSSSSDQSVSSSSADPAPIDGRLVTFKLLGPNAGAAVQSLLRDTQLDPATIRKASDANPGTVLHVATVFQSALVDSSVGVLPDGHVTEATLRGMLVQASVLANDAHASPASSAAVQHAALSADPFAAESEFLALPSSSQAAKVQRRSTKAGAAGEPLPASKKARPDAGVAATSSSSPAAAGNSSFVGIPMTIVVRAQNSTTTRTQAKHGNGTTGTSLVAGIAGCDVLVSARFARLVWNRLVTAGRAHAVGSLEWSSICSEAGAAGAWHNPDANALHVFPRDYPECAAHAHLWQNHEERAVVAQGKRRGGVVPCHLALRSWSPHAPRWALVWPELGEGSTKLPLVVRHRQFASAFLSNSGHDGDDSVDVGADALNDGGTGDGTETLGANTSATGTSNPHLRSLFARLTQLGDSVFPLPPNLTPQPTLLPFKLRVAGRGVPQQCAGIYAPTSDDVQQWRSAIAAFRQRGRRSDTQPSKSASASAALAASSSAGQRALEALTYPTDRWWRGIQEAPISDAALAAGRAASTIRSEPNGQRGASPAHAPAAGALSENAAGDPAKAGAADDDWWLSSHVPAIVAADAVPSRRLIGYVTSGCLSKRISRGVGTAFVRAEAAAALVKAGYVFARSHAPAASKADNSSDLDTADNDGADGGQHVTLMVLLRNPESAHYRPALLRLA